MDEKVVGKEWVLDYVEIGGELYGCRKNGEGFMKLSGRGLGERVEKKDGNGSMSGGEKLYYKERGVCFEYKMV